MNLQNKRLSGIVLVIGFLLLIPLIAGFPWTLLDFVVGGFMLLITGLLCELVLRKVKKLEFRVALCGVILGGLVLIWAAIVNSE